MTTVHIMLDLETWGKTPGCDIRSIGACVFDPLTGHTPNPQNGGDEFSNCFYRATDNPDISEYSQFGQHSPKYPLTRDPETVAWWNKQSPEAQAAFDNPIDLRDALRALSEWLDMVTTPPPINNDTIEWIDAFRVHERQNVRIWSHGPAFDVPILAAAYAATGLPVPWHYRAPRDTRTAFDMAGIDDHSAHLARYNTGTHYHALDDAITQARAVCGAYERLRTPDPHLVQAIGLAVEAHPDSAQVRNAAFVAGIPINIDLGTELKKDLLVAKDITNKIVAEMNVTPPLECRCQLRLDGKCFCNETRS